VAKKNRIYIGTSGWNYSHWKGPFYPDTLQSALWLPHYADCFDTVEINNSFYQLPSEKRFQQWHDAVPDGFIFSVKASRYITHMKKLKDPDEPVERLLEHVKPLRDKRGVILFQLPPKWHRNVDRLEAFLDRLPETHRYTFEFRDSTWWDASVYRCLHRHNAAFCIFDLAGRVSPREVTADFVYIRLHGPAEAYQGSYDSPALSGWAGACAAWKRQDRDVFVYFDNDRNGYAPQNARRFKAMC